MESVELKGVGSWVPSSAPAKSSLFGYLFFLVVEVGVRLLGRVGRAGVDGILGAVRGAGKILSSLVSYF